MKKTVNLLLCAFAIIAIGCGTSKRITGNNFVPWTLDTAKQYQLEDQRIIQFYITGGDILLSRVVSIKKRGVVDGVLQFIDSTYEEKIIIHDGKPGIVTGYDTLHQNSPAWLCILFEEDNQKCYLPFFLGKNSHRYCFALDSKICKVYSGRVSIEYDNKQFWAPEEAKKVYLSVKINQISGSDKKTKEVGGAVLKNY